MPLTSTAMTAISMVPKASIPRNTNTGLEVSLTKSASAAEASSTGSPRPNIPGRLFLRPLPRLFVMRSCLRLSASADANKMIGRYIGHIMQS